jgi:hypothetical protein
VVTVNYKWYKSVGKTVRALKFTIETEERIFAWCGPHIESRFKIPKEQDSKIPTTRFYIHTLAGLVETRYGDYIIKSAHGEFYPCNEQLFNNMYKEVR